MDAITQLFEGVAGLIEDQYPLVEDKFGPGFYNILSLQQTDLVYSFHYLR